MSIIENSTAEQAEQTESVEETATVETVAQVVQIDPNVLVVEENIRREVNLPRKFVNSVKLHGVIVPILAHPDTDGQIVVRDGQRRTLAAREAGIASIPAYVVDANDAKTVRIVQQIITNEHREGLTDADRATAWRQLALEGMSVTAIAKQTGAKREEVKTGLTVAEHEVASDAVAKYDLTLDQAARLINFADDPDTLAELTKVARTNPDSFDFYAQRALDDKETREQIADLRAQYEAQGFTVVDFPSYYDEGDTAFLTDLQDADGTPLTVENYQGKPGYAVAVGERWGRVEVGHVVTDWKTHGLRKITRGGSVSGKMTEEEKAARRTLIANNKAWRSADTVRKQWLAKFLGRKRLPSDALPYAASVLASETTLLADVSRNAHATAEKVMGYEHQWATHPLGTLATETPTKAGHVVVALALGLLEDSTSVTTWRNPADRDARYFQRLAAWGYHLSDVERIVTGEQPDDPDEAEATPGEEAVEVTTDTSIPEGAEPEATGPDEGAPVEEESDEDDDTTDAEEPQGGTDDAGEAEPEDAESDDADAHLTAA
ncbi:ParB/RepB/Spo0J family partition protein [Microbacterium rhizophilus]|uniref:ParB/RepB/Spo0J family partition protein n=1 Tax=Microbacterium rhizophilus TaxID=3138934 RepID=UPI0031E7096B